MTTCPIDACENTAGQSGYCGNHTARPGVRVARVCVHDRGKPSACDWREFSRPDAVCPEHGARSSVDQPNRPYMGQATT